MCLRPWGLPGNSQAQLAPAGSSPAVSGRGHLQEELVPYKDLEQRRRYDRESKRRLRARQGLTRHRPASGSKAYICLKYPHLRLLPGIVFRDGWLVTDDLEVQARIEQDPEYGRHMFSWRLEP